MTDPKPSPKPKKRRGIAGKLVRGVLAVVGGIVTLVLLALVGLQTTPAKRWLADEIEKAASQPDMTIKIGALEGFIPFSPIVRDVTLADAKGVWLEISRAQVAVAPAALIESKSVIATVEVDGARVLRQPVFAKSPPPQPEQPVIALPELPLTVRVTSIALRRIVVEKPLIGRAVTLNLDGKAIIPANGRQASAELALDWDGGNGRARLAARVRPKGQIVVLRASVGEKPGGLVAALGKLPPAFAYGVTVNGSGPLDKWVGKVSARIDGFKTGDKGVDALLGTRATIASNLQLAIAGEVRLTDLRVAAGGVSLSGETAITKQFEQISGKIGYRVRDLAPLEPTIGAKVTGAISGAATLSGSLTGPDVVLAVDSPRLIVNGETVTGLAVRTTAKGLPDRPRGTFGLAATTSGKTAKLSVDYVLADNRLALTKLLAESEGAKISGAMTVALDTALVDGKVRADVRDIATWARLAGVEAAGRLDANVTLTARGGRQAVAADAKADAIRIRTGKSSFTVGALTLKADLPDVAKPQRGSATLSIKAATAGELRISSFVAQVRGGADALGFTINGAGSAGHPFTVASKGSVRLAAGRQVLRLQAFDARFAGQPIVLQSPVTVTKDGERLSVDDFRAKLATGTVTAKASIGAARASIAVAGRALPVSLLEIAQPNLPIDGTIDVTLRLDGPAKAPQGTVTLSARGIGPKDKKRLKLPTLRIDAKGKIGGGVLALNGAIQGVGRETFQINGRVPLTLSLAPFAVAAPPRKPLAVGLKGAIDLAYLSTLAPIGESRISGRAQIALEVAGTPSAPVVAGTVTVDKARYESITSGAVLQDIAFTATGDGRSIKITRLSGTDGKGGKVSGEGIIALDDGAVGGLDVKVALAGFRVLRLDEARVRLSGKVAVKGTALAPRVTGKLSVDRGEVFLPESLPANIDTIDVEMLDGTAGKLGRKAAKKPAKPKRQGSQATLDLDIVVPGRFFLRGQGLVSEWRGALKVEGSTADPQMTGKLSVVRGHFSLLSKRFTFSRGDVTFSGVVDDPTLDILAEAKATQLVAKLAITGRAKKPKLTLSSDPVLPQDEVLARVMFGREAGRLSPLQAVQLAQAAAALSGGGSAVSITDRFRTALGIDTLDFEGGGDGKTKPGVRVGKYVTDKVYLSVKQGASPQDSKVTVEVEITPNVSVESSTGATGDPDIGVVYRYDY